MKQYNGYDIWEKLVQLNPMTYFIQEATLDYQRSLKTVTVSINRRLQNRDNLPDYECQSSASFLYGYKVVIIATEVNALSVSWINHCCLLKPHVFFCQ